MPDGPHRIVFVLVPPVMAFDVSIARMVFGALPDRYRVVQSAAEPGPVEDAHARISPRTLTRRFHAETGQSPLQWLLHHQIERARELLETTDLGMDQVAYRSGLGSADSLRAHFVRRVGTTPRAYRLRSQRVKTPSAS
ncbi:helix-turn-helix domain-containing protein [Actinomadura sp. NPDC047616]|uniref:helix-turn-helix domain-containing protein n=1 Tax=Actinomadura sp. NPDC047616 TaxID=3155914 RepID=UPI0033D484FE